MSTREVLSRHGGKIGIVGLMSLVLTGFQIWNEANKAAHERRERNVHISLAETQADQERRICALEHRRWTETGCRDRKRP